jgi:hypothetical protein
MASAERLAMRGREALPHRRLGRARRDVDVVIQDRHQVAKRTTSLAWPQATCQMA